MNLHPLRERHPRLGTWMSIGSPVITELAADSGFDWLLFDLEHGCGTEAGVLGQLQAMRGSGAAAIVRVGAPHPDLIGRVLDWGADGIMVPHVSTPEEAEACVQAMRYPPRGRRGVARSVRTYGYGLRPAVDGVEPAPVLFAQIETIEAVENSAVIAAIDGVDVLFIGPADLQHDLRARPNLAKREYRACLEHVSAQAAAAGKPCGILLREPADVDTHRAQGFTHIAIETDLGILRKGYQELLRIRQTL